MQTWLVPGVFVRICQSVPAIGLDDEAAVAEGAEA